jgi:hypothetical protein
MALGYHGAAYNEDPPGLRYRKEQLAAAESEARQAGEMSSEARPGMGLTGTVSTSRAVQSARAALKRQQNVAQGKPALDDSN